MAALRERGSVLASLREGAAMKKKRSLTSDQRAVQLFKLLRERNPDFDLIVEIFTMPKAGAFKLTPSMRRMIERLRS